LEHKIENISPSKKKIDFTISTEELQPHYDQAYRKARKNISQPGFRKGKVPVSVIKKKYGPAIENEASQDIINQEFGKFAQEQQLRIVGTPNLTDIKKNEDGSLSFVIEFDTIPDVQLSDYKGLTIDEPMHAVSDDEIRDELDNILRNQGDLEPADQVEDEHHVVGLTLRTIDKETNEVSQEDEPQETNVYLADKNVLPEMKELLLNTKAGDTFRFTPDDHTHSHDDGEDHDHQAHEHTEYEVTVNDIQKLVPKELNEDFVKEYTKERFSDPDDLKEEIGYQLQEQWDKQSRQVMENQIVDKLVSDNDVEAPESAVREMTDVIYADMHKRYGGTPENRPDLTEEMRIELAPMAEKSVKWEIIRGQIVREEGLTVEDHDIEPFAQQEAARAGMEADKVLKMLKSNPQFTTSILSKKVMDLILDFAITQETDFEGNPIDQTSFSSTAYTDNDDEQEADQTTEEKPLSKDSSDDKKYKEEKPKKKKKSKKKED
jgi:trigger factor